MKRVISFSPKNTEQRITIFDRFVVAFRADRMGFTLKVWDRKRTFQALRALEDEIA